MRCIVAAARPMLSSQKYFPEGPTHAIPLLQLALPGIDPNDLGKTMVRGFTNLRNQSRKVAGHY